MNNLDLLSPEYHAKHHKQYADILLEAIEQQERARNIALAGAYGAGKSSVLCGVRQQLVERKHPRFRRAYRVVDVGLSSFKNVGRESPKADDASVPDQAHDDDGRTADAPLARKEEEDEQARELQKEIVKRLLYSAKPEDLPDSRFNRIRPRSARREYWTTLLGVSTFVALATLWVLVLPGGAPLWVTEWASTPLRSIFALLLPIGATTLAIVGVRRWLAAARVRQVGLGPASVTLSEAEALYFDEYLDEIIYFFEQTQTDVVIFEDLDRFENARIFRSLRDLNSLINTSPSVQQNVVFVYAVRDSLFEVGAESDGAQDGVSSSARYGVDSAASERAKFFDLIVPIVPFITHEGSSALFLESLMTLPDHLAPKPDLVEMIGRAFPDMRVLKSLKTEYVVFSRVLLEGGDHDIPLDHNQLLSVLAYKHLALEDFERIRIGHSKLDELTDAIRRQVDSHLRWLEEEIARLLDEQAAHDIEAEVLAAAGMKFSRLFTALGGFPGLPQQQEHIVIVGGRRFTSEQFKDIDFWSAVVTHGGRVELRSHPQQRQLAWLDLTNLADFLGFSGPVDSWLAPDIDQHERKVAELQQRRTDLVRASLSERVSNPSLGGPGVDQDDANMVATAEKILGNGLALQLVRAGYIDHNFTLYASRYYSAFRSANVTTYMLQVIDRRQTEYDRKLTEAEVWELLKHSGTRFLASSSGLNISIFDALLGTEEISPALEALGHGHLDPKGEFIETYLVRGRKVDGFVKTLAPTRNDILVLITRTRRITEERKVKLLDIALARLSSDLEYLTGPELHSVLEKRAGELREALTTQDNDTANRLTEVLEASHARVPSLQDVSPTVKEALVHSGTFELTLENLGVITGDSDRVGLDTILSLDSSAFDYVRKDLRTYLAAVEEADRHSIDEASALAEVLAHLGDVEGDTVEHLCSFAPKEACVPLLADVPENCWAGLVRTRRMSPNAGNLVAYIDHVGGPDDALAAYLGQIDSISTDSAEQADRRLLANAVACLSSLEVETQLSLIRDLNIDDGLGPEEVKEADGILLARLVSAGLVANSVELVNALADRDWGDRERVLAEIDLEEHFDQVDWRAGDMGRIVDSTALSPSSKLAALKHASQDETDLTPELAEKLTQLAEEAGYSLDAEMFDGLISVGVESRRIADLLGSLGSELPDAEVIDLLSALEGDFALLAVADGKRPQLRWSQGLEQLLRRLRELGFVSSYTVEEGDEKIIRVNKRRPTE